MFLAGQYYLAGTLVSVNVLFNIVPPPIEKVSSVGDVDFGTFNLSVCEIPVLSIRSAPAHIFNIRERWGKQHLNESGVS